MITSYYVILAHRVDKSTRRVEMIGQELKNGSIECMCFDEHGYPQVSAVPLEDIRYFSVLYGVTAMLRGRKRACPVVSFSSGRDLHDALCREGYRPITRQISATDGIFFTLPDR